MSLPAFATVAELTARAGELGDDARMQAALADGAAMMRGEVNETWTVEGELDFTGFPEWAADALRAINIAAARRILTNPEGLEGETIDGYTSEFSNASADVYLTKGEKRTLHRAAGQLVGVGVISTTRGPIETASLVQDCWPDASDMAEETEPWTLMG